jgi:cytidylate kinase
MAIDLVKYFDERYQDSLFQRASGTRPFVTISRQSGCNSFEISKMLVHMINEQSKSKWKLINKEIIDLSANKLNIDHRHVEKVFDAEKHSHIEEILRAFGDRNYKSDKVIHRTIRQLIRNIALDGNVVIVGRAGAAITSDLAHGIHIRLEAPFSWRIKNMASKRKITENEGHGLVSELDKSREQLFLDLGKKAIDDVLFDLRFNNSTLTDDEIARSIFQLLQLRHLI